MGYVLHLHERHRRRLIFDPWRADCEVDQSAKVIISSIPALELVDSYLHRATPFFNASSRSPPTSFSPKTFSIQLLTSFAAAGVYLSRRNLRRSLSSDETEAMTVHPQWRDGVW